MSFGINNKLSFIDSFRFLRYSLDRLVKTLNKDDFKYLIQKFDSNVQDLDLYLKCDVLPLTNVFEKFKNKSLKNYGLYSSLYLSAPALTWDAMLNVTKVKIELNPDPEMYIFLWWSFLYF